MPPYTPVTSKAQSRKLFALANEGKISREDAAGKTRAAGDFQKLPARAGRATARRSKKASPRRSAARGV